MKIGDLVRYVGTRDAEFLGLITKESRIQSAHPYSIEYYVVWATVENPGWWPKGLLKKVTNENR
jgi:hypothetical protein